MTAAIYGGFEHLGPQKPDAFWHHFRHKYFMSKKHLHRVLGIDPGFTGGFAIIDFESNRIVAVEPMPLKAESKMIPGSTRQVDAQALKEMIYKSLMPDVFDTAAAIEEVGSRPNQGLQSTFRFGESYGIAQGVVGALGIKLYKTTPAVWKSALNLSRNKNDSLALASKLWPNYDFIWT